MKRYLLTVVATALATSICWYTWFSFKVAFERKRLLSAVEVPGRMALEDLNADLSRGRYDVAQAKLSVLRQQWDIFDRDGLSGQALGQVMVAFSRVDPEGGGTLKTEPDGATNRSQPIGSETNRAPATAGSGR